MPDDRLVLAGARLNAAMSRLRELHPDMTVLQAQCFFTIAANPDVMQRELHTLLGVTDAHASRAVAMLGEFGSRNVPAMNLVESAVDPDDRRIRRTNLTTRGRRLLNDILRDLKGIN